MLNTDFLFMGPRCVNGRTLVFLAWKPRLAQHLVSMGPLRCKESLMEMYKGDVDLHFFFFTTRMCNLRNENTLDIRTCNGLSIVIIIELQSLVYEAPTLTKEFYG